MFRVRNVKKEYESGNGKRVCVLQDISMDIPDSKLIILRGRSGSGKTTLLNIMGMLEAPTSGELWLDDRAYSSIDERKREAVRRYEMGYVFQSVALVPIMTAYENVDFGLRTAGVREDRDELICEALESVGLLERRKHMPAQMSGGEQQRVAIARAFAGRPKIIFADEPTGALDTAGGVKVVLLFRELIERYGTTVVMTTHDMGLVRYGDVVWGIEDGKLQIM